MLQTNLHPDWKIVEDRLIRDFKFADFSTALAFVNQVGERAESLNHHPDIEIHDYNQVTLTLSTHKEKRVTDKDFQLAEVIDQL